METILRLVLFCLFSYGMIIVFYKLYRLLNQKIISSNTALQIIGFSILLILANILLFFGGILAFFKIYEFLAV